MGQAERSKALRERRIAAGLCLDCGKRPPVTKTQCEECRKRRSRMRKAFRSRKTEGMCSHALCRKPCAPGHRTCPKHLAERRQRRSNLIAAGLCSCGKPNSKGKGYCNSCTEQKRHRRQEIRQQIFNHYGRSCICCGESTPLFLTLDHVEGGGHFHRQTVTGGRAGIRFYRWLLRQNLPGGYQVLCWNCNVGRHLNGGVCPHHQIRTASDGDDPSPCSPRKPEAPLPSEQLPSGHFDLSCSGVG